MVENFIAAIFPTLEEAAAANAALIELSRQGRVCLERSELVGRSWNGELVSEDFDAGASELIKAVTPPGERDEEAQDALASILPPGMHALLARVSESEPTPIDDAVGANGGIVYRRSVEGS